MKLLSLYAVAVCLVAAPVCFAADHPQTQAQAQLLDHAEFLCDNCFFGASKYYYCFAADNKILIGYQKTPVFNYADDSKNYLTGIRPSWTAWSAPGQTVPVGYSEKHIWLTRPSPEKPLHGFWSHLKGGGIWASRGQGKKVKLTRSSMSDIFIHDARCRAANANPAPAR